MSAHKSKTHKVTVTVRFDAPLTVRQAAYAVWNAIHGHELYGDGKPTKQFPEPVAEPYGKGKITVPRT